MTILKNEWLVYQHYFFGGLFGRGGERAPQPPSECGDSERDFGAKPGELVPDLNQLKKIYPIGDLKRAISVSISNVSHLLSRDLPNAISCNDSGRLTLSSPFK
ncbi:hypothetical protein CEXT_117571 [Caerostris extrusa]|uniref:Uncharacterized protein n=1 Tax=Caerostris extrusa TaxID=172846 RepID=A0AAV4R0G2_CAEEX|nr:hypothetical protein CEXT_117571 [Caerostris extrusa]